MLKKIMMLALAATAVAAVTAPMASANWTHNGVNIPAGTNPQVQFTGQALFTSAVVGGINCQTDAKVQLEGGSTTGKVTQFEVDLTEAASTVTKKCVTSGPIAPCLVKSVQATSLPWQIHSDGADVVTITTGEIDNVLESQTGGACGVVQQIKLKPGTVSALIPAGQTKAISIVHLSGQLETTTGSKVQIAGTQNVTPSGTYGTSTT
jgi:hypothetical protein